jgi:hypothetical protein
MGGVIGANMAAKKKTWREKLADSKGFPKVFKIDPVRSKRWGLAGASTMVIPAPLEVDELMGRVPTGKLTTIDQLRKTLARRHGATMACPITTGIFAWIAAHAAAEGEAAGETRTTPFWRTLKTGGELNIKYPGGVGLVKRKLRAEGHTIRQKGKRFFVEGFDRHLAVLAIARRQRAV